MRQHKFPLIAQLNTGPINFHVHQLPSVGFRPKPFKKLYHLHLRNGPIAFSISRRLPTVMTTDAVHKMHTTIILQVQGKIIWHILTTPLPTYHLIGDQCLRQHTKVGL